MKNFSDVLIIGTGLAGISCAFNIDQKKSIIMLSKDKWDNSNSCLAQGGIAAAISLQDNPELHAMDTLKVGSYFNNKQAVDILVKKGAKYVKELIDMNAPFDLDLNSNVKLTLEAGHSKRRILHANGDDTGREITTFLFNKVKNRKNIKVFENTMALDFIFNNEEVIGLYAKSNELNLEFYFDKVVIASGGIGKIFKNSTNAIGIQGDGIAMAYRAGCEIENMEFVQFHPTVFYEEKLKEKFLISEALRGEGAILRNKNKEAFMKKYHKDLELAPRDVVSRSILQEVKETKSKCAYLDITSKSKAFIEKRFPKIFSFCLKQGLDISKDFIPVLPAQHYLIGGIKVNLMGETNIKNIFACGECSSTGVHGANRLASNSLLECIVFSKQIAQKINSSNQNKLEIKNIKKINRNFKTDKKWNLKLETSDSLGVFRNKEKIEKFYNKLLKENYIDEIEYNNAKTIANLIAKACLKRKENIGCHYIKES